MMKQKTNGKSRRISSARRVRSPILAHSVGYTGSPDSEVVASYVERFTYDPERKQEMQKKYAALLKEK